MNFGNIQQQRYAITQSFQHFNFLENPKIMIEMSTIFNYKKSKFCLDCSYANTSRCRKSDFRARMFVPTSNENKRVEQDVATESKAFKHMLHNSDFVISSTVK